MFSLEMQGAVKRNENRRAEIWFTAMLPSFENPLTLEEFVSGGRDKRAELIKCIEAWEKIDRALIAGR